MNFPKSWSLKGLLPMLALLLASAGAHAHLAETFNRTDSATLGNNWVEKSPAAFSIAGNAVAKQAVSTWYRDNIVYRPANEDVLNVEAAMEFRILGTPPGYPQLLARVQSATVATTDVLDGYILFFEDTTARAVLGRQTGNQYPAILATLELTQPITTADSLRMRLRATGTNPVLLEAYIERLVGGIWQTIGQANYSDSSAQRISNAGSVGFSGYVESSYVFDNFTRVDLGAIGTTNPAPAATSLAPNTATAGESGLTLVVYGNGFTTDSTVRWNGSNRATTYVSPSELEATVNAADLAATGTANVTVFNPTPGGGTSSAQTFQITGGQTTPAPAITSLAPTTVVAGNAAFTLTVNGSNFNNGSTVRWNGANRTTTFVSATQLQAAITAGDVATSGTAVVTVYRTSDAVSSTGATFTITAPTAAADFTDSFARADSGTVGNGWLEKVDSAYSLVGGELAKIGAGGNDYRNNIVYRPASENLLDVEAAVEVRFLSTAVGYPQVLVRGQGDTIATTNQLDAYIMYVNGGTSQAVLARQRGSAYDVQLTSFTLSPALNTTDRYRMRLRAVGTNPVVLNGYIERLNGSAWQIIGQTSFNDTATARIATAGSVGVGGYIETSYRYDNFVRTNLNVSAPNPAPATTGITPSTATAGASNTQIAVNGSNFVAGSVVRWNGADRTTTYVSATQLQATVTAADLANAGTATVTVFSPSPGGGTSNGQTFTINAPATNPAPIATTLSPASTAAGSAAFVLAVQGSGFVNGSVIRWNGANRTTTYISGTELRTNIAASDVSSTGTRTVAVVTPAPGGGTSATLNFQVTAAANPAPTTTGMSPNTIAANSSAFTLTVNGTGFVNGSTVRWNGGDRATTFVSSTELTATILATDVSTTGTRTVTVFSPSPGGGTSNGQTFTVTTATQNNPLPVLNQLNPQAVMPGGGAFTLTVTGSGFTNTSVVRWNGVARTTTFVSATELRANITSADVATAGLGAVTVVTPAPGGGTSTPLTVFVQDLSLTYFFDGFNRANAADVGSNWTEKTPGAFALQGNQVVSFQTTYGFPEDIMYRPAAEDRLNSEASVEFVRLPSQPYLDFANFPQLHSRIQRSTVGQFYTLDSYIFFVDDVSGNAMFAITRAPSPGIRWECYIAPVALTEDLIEGERYRLRSRVSGTAPVQLNGTVERFVNGAWQTIAAGSATHSVSTQRDPSLYCDQPTLPAPITTGGAAGVAKYTNRTDNYDNFFWRELQPGSAPPAIGGLSPQSVTAGSAGFELTVNGTGFAADSAIWWNGAARTTTYVSPTVLRTTVSAADVSLPGSVNVWVQTNSTGLVSNSAQFQILPASAAETLFDSFTRTDGATIGNGWLEKTPSAFSIVSGRAQKLATPGGDYRDNLVYRPASEDTLNVEASMEMRFQSTPYGYPQLAARAQSSSINTVNGLTAYLLYVADSGTMVTLARQVGTGYDTALATFGLSASLNTTDTFRMRLQVVGTNPVRLTAIVERQNGSGWDIIGQRTYDDTSGSRITTPGSVGFGGYVESNYSFDNFRRLDLGQ